MHRATCGNLQSHLQLLGFRVADACMEPHMATCKATRDNALFY